MPSWLLLRLLRHHEDSLAAYTAHTLDEELCANAVKYNHRRRREKGGSSE